jgi:amidase
LTPLWDHIATCDASALAEAIRLRRFSVVDIVSAHFERIERLNHTVNALVTLDRAQALMRAEQADRDLAKGDLWGPLHGVPFTVKDSIETANVRTTAGYRPRLGIIPKSDAFAVGKLKSAGGILIGKTNCATLCCDVQTKNDIFGRTNNPWDKSRTSGGSSGGEAAAISLALSPLGIGTDTGGSIRIPASYCGVFGYKSSIGKIPRDGIIPLRPDGGTIQDSLTVVGAMARSVRDLVLFHQIMSESPLSQVSNSRPVSVSWSDTSNNPLIDDDSARLYLNCLRKLQSVGVNASQVNSPVDMRAMAKVFARLYLYEFMPKENSRFLHFMFWSWNSLNSLVRRRRHDAYHELKKTQSIATAKFQELFASYDCWIIPATASAAFRHQPPGWPVSIVREGKNVRCGYLSASAGFTCPINVLGNPSVVIPVGFNKNSLPIAIQVVGKLGQDERLLQVATILSQKLGSPP